MALGLVLLEAAVCLDGLSQSLLLLGLRDHLRPPYLLLPDLRCPVLLPQMVDFDPLLRIPAVEHHDALL